MRLKYSTPFVRTSLHILAIMALLAGITTNVSTAYAAPPVNDEFATAKKMAANTSATISDINTATSNGTDPSNSCTGDAGEESVWYSFTPIVSGELTLGTANSAFDTVLTLWKEDPFAPGDPSALVEIRCNDNDPRVIGKKTSYLSIPVRGGVKYYIEVVRKTGTAFSPPDKLSFSLAFAAKAIAFPNWSDPAPYNDTESIFYYSATGWTNNVAGGPPPSLLWYSDLHVSNNPGDIVTIYFDGEEATLEYAMGSIFGNADIFIDGVFAGTLGQNSVGYLSTKQGSAPIWSTSSFMYPLSDNVHRIVIKNANPSLKINVDGIRVAPHADFFPPDAITDLIATTGTGAGKVTLKWTAPGDDGMVGRVAGYEVRYSANQITNDAGNPFDPNDWAAATPLPIGVPSPLPAGSTQSMTAQGLSPGLTYWFAVKAVDEAGNESALSNTDDAVSNAPTPIGPGVYDDKHSGWSYDGVWQIVSRSEAYANYFHLATQLGSTATFYFTGTQFRLAYISDLNMGPVDVYIDGAYVTSIDEYSPFALNRTYVSPILGGGVPGPHVVVFVKVSPLAFINVDVITIVNSTDGGPPDPIVDLVAIPGLNDGEVDLSWTATGEDPGGLGTATKYEVRYSNAPITTELEFIGATPVAGFVPVPSTAGTPESLTVFGLIPGLNYYFAVRALDDGMGGYVVLSNTDDAVAFNAAGYAGSGLYQNSDLFGSGGFWRFYSWAAGFFSPASNGDMHTTTLAGASALFTFNGGGFTLYYQKGYNFGTLKVYVDGVQVGSISQRNLTSQWQRTWSWLGAAGNHTVQFISSGGKTTIDAILIP